MFVMVATIVYKSFKMMSSVDRIVYDVNLDEMNYVFKTEHFKVLL